MEESTTYQLIVKRGRIQEARVLNATKIRHNALRYSGLWVGAEERRTFGA